MSRFTRISTKALHAAAKANILPAIFDHVTNTTRPRAHRIFAGIIVSIAGVMISHSGPHDYIISILCDHIGYAFHGIGILPFIGELEKH